MFTEYLFQNHANWIDNLRCLPVETGWVRFLSVQTLTISPGNTRRPYLLRLCRASDGSALLLSWSKQKLTAWYYQQHLNQNSNSSHGGAYHSPMEKTFYDAINFKYSGINNFVGAKFCWLSNFHRFMGT